MKSSTAFGKNFESRLKALGARSETTIPLAESARERKDSERIRAPQYASGAIPQTSSLRTTIGRLNWPKGSRRTAKIGPIFCSPHRRVSPHRQRSCLTASPADGTCFHNSGSNPASIRNRESTVGGGAINVGDPVEPMPNRLTK